jgi:SulP family sulfate permease
MDQLRHTRFLTTFGGQVFVSHYEALLALDPDTARRALKPHSPVSEMTSHGH